MHTLISFPRNLQNVGYYLTADHGKKSFFFKQRNRDVAARSCFSTSEVMMVHGLAVCKAGMLQYWHTLNGNNYAWMIDTVSHSGTPCLKMNEYDI